MANLAAASMIVLALLTAGFVAPARAQTQASAASSISSEELESLRRDKNQLALYHYGSRYTFDVLLGVIGGGILGATLRGGAPATILGSTLGSLLGILWFVDGYAGEMIDKHGW